MKLFRLIVHQKNFSEEDLIINPKDYPGAHAGDIVEIYHPEDEGPRLLLQIKTFKEDLQGKETISVEQSIASAFGLRTYADVCVRLVSPSDVALDSVEITFKDQYMGRSEMWRLKKSLVNTCVYMNKKLEFCGNIRCQVYEMWSQGDRVACGVINDDTKVVFRSSTSMVYLFLQMSSEMWDFDIHGDLYFEKAVNGFLADLFQKWKKNGSNHEVTIVLFSRTFYDANSLEEFPQYMRECLQIDYRGRYYEDFYRVAVQNERYDDWSCILVQLRRLFSGYLKIVLEYHSRPGQNIPPATNSTAAQGNFLEVLNMSLNVFEKHYLDRSFDRTGQLSVVVTPGVGVFEVDRELTNVTKQRIIDNGVGSDLVCVGEQPLHAVPLLKVFHNLSKTLNCLIIKTFSCPTNCANRMAQLFHNKDTHISVPDDYSMPHWINLSFYSTNKKVAYSNFIPRIKLPPRRTAYHKTKDANIKSKLLQEDECIHNSFFDYDAYDAQVFQLPHVHGTRSLQRVTSRMKKTSVTTEDMRENFNKNARRKMSDPDIHHVNTETVSPASARSQAITIPPHNNIQTVSPVVSPHSINSEVNKTRVWPNENLETELSSPLRAVVGSAGSPPPLSLASAILRPGRALINPFDPSHVTIKLTSNRRRWTHIFPKGPTGVLIQQHHYQAVPAQSERSSSGSANGISSSPGPDPFIPNSQLTRSVSQIALQEYCKKRPSLLHTNSGTSTTANNSNPSKSLTLLWGATGEQEWTPALTTGVDWKSLTISACLPITTDYFPDQRALQNDYVVSDYNLLPDDVNADFAQQRAIYRQPLKTAEVFRELISQRLSQGFQLIVLPNQSNEIIQTPGNKGQSNVTGSLVVKRLPETEDTQEYLLSIGRVFHKISLCGSTITVTRYRPRHPYPPFNIHYRYRFHAPHHDTYEVSWVSFTTEKLETYNWNYLDHYICTRGDTDFALVEAIKYWRFRVYLLPLNNSATKRIIEGAQHCDIYTPLNNSDYANLVEGFLKFIETVVNKIKRPNPKKPRMSLCVQSIPLTQTLAPRRYSMSNMPQTTVINNSPFRERLGSNRLPDRPRPRSGSKVMERGRVSPATEASQPQESQENNHLEEGELNVLKATSSNAEILESLRHPATGVGFLTITPTILPSLTFVSADAVHWLINHLEGVTTIDQAVNIMNIMLRERLICHASGDFSKPFVFGFYLYQIVSNEKDLNDSKHKQFGDLQSFENEWLEVEVRPPRIGTQENLIPRGLSVPNAVVDREKNVPYFLKDNIDLEYLQGELDNDCPLYKHNHLEIDIMGKSDRIEWGHARYQTVYRPDQAYELVVQWVTASGSIVSEMLFGWARKAQACGLQMIPIPHDPLALPYSNKSDPLRGPIFIPLNVEPLMKSKSHLFEDFREDSWPDRLFLFQEAIAQKFGFIPCVVESISNSGSGPMMQDHQYVHCTGAMFLLIPTMVQKIRNRLTSVSQRRSGQINKRYPIHTDVVPSPHEAYITRHVSGKNKNNYDDTRRIGFLWSWNHMISRRWRTSQALDNTVLLKVLRDFKQFCANHDDRLKTYWDHSWELKEDASTLTM